MIVKLRTTKIDEGINTSWVYFDGFRKVKAINLRNFDGVDKYESDYMVVNYEDVKNYKEGSLLICSLKYKEESNGKDEYVILTNQPVYLLNDEGKTIERIY